MVHEAARIVRLQRRQEGSQGAIAGRMPTALREPPIWVTRLTVTYGFYCTIVDLHNVRIIRCVSGGVDTVT